MVLLNPPASVTYTGQLFPLVAIGAGSLFSKGFRKNPDNIFGFQLIRIILLIIMVILNINATINFIVHPSMTPGMGSNYATDIEYIHQYIPHDKVIMGPAGFYNYLLEYPLFLEYKEGTKYTIAIRGEDYLTFWNREKPVVFIGDPLQDPMLWTYMQNQGGFKEVRPDLWISKNLGDDKRFSSENSYRDSKDDKIP